MKLELDLEPISDLKKDQNYPLIIAGPCSAENEEQMVSTAIQIAAKTKASIFRAGIWKPRTRPGMFEGVGERGLEWMKTVKQETGFKLATEVANPQHVEVCLKAGVDVLWIGARTTVNPFAVQEIADALRGTDVTVLIKNPVNPDVQLWMGSLERVNKAGIKRLAAIHRGFSAYEQSIFRNIPLWEMAIELRTACPNLPIICDPSHIAGNTELIPFVSQKAIDLDMYGLMIETHINPKVALFFLAFLPQFVVPGSGGIGAQMFWLGLVFMLQAVVVLSGIAVLAGSVGEALRRNPGVAQGGAWLTAGIFAALGLRLVFSQR